MIMLKQSNIPDWWAALTEKEKRIYLKNHPNSSLPLVPQVVMNPAVYKGQLPPWMRQEINALRGSYASAVADVIEANKGKTFGSPREMYKTIGHEVRHKICRNFLDILKQADQSYDLNVSDKQQLQSTIQRLENYYKNHQLDLFKDTVAEQLQDMIEDKAQALTEPFLIPDFLRVYKILSKFFKTRNRLQNKHTAFIHRQFVKYAINGSCNF